MKVTFKKEELLLAITKSLGCVSTEKTINSIEGILITTVGESQCQLCAYDLEKGIKIMVSAEVESGGVIVMNGNKLSSIVKYMPGNVTIETNPEEESGMAVVSSGRSKFQIHFISGDTFPQMPELNPDRRFSLEACRCIGACGLAPVLTVNEEVYGRLGVDDVPGIVAKYRA